MKSVSFVTFLCLTLLCVHIHGVRSAVVQLPSNLKINITDSSTSGLSSGGFMAVQLHVAFSNLFRGVGVFAGGPYDCAQGSESKATGVCLSGLPSGVPVSTLVSITKTRSSSGAVDPVSNLNFARVYLFSGTLDFTVHQAVVTSCQTYYQNFISSSGAILYENTLEASHTWPTDNPNAPNPCTVSESPYVARCSYDGAGTALQQIYGSLNPRTPWSGTLNGTLINFDQTPFGSASAGMASSGYAYIPDACSAGTVVCKIHVALHGCLQNAQKVGTSFATGTGLNQWADTNNIIVLYPQIECTGSLGGNPECCWDWWGYLSTQDSSIYDTKTGPQMLAILKMMKQLSGSSLS